MDEFSNSAKDGQGHIRQESAAKEEGNQEGEPTTNGHSAVEVLRRENRVLRQQASILHVEMSHQMVLYVLLPSN